jgi:hypothetical protein
MVGVAAVTIVAAALSVAVAIHRKAVRRRLGRAVSSCGR